MKSKDIRCTICDSVFSGGIQVNYCPNCKTTSLPQWIADDVQITINLHDLRILTIWADNWAYHCDNHKSALDNPRHESLCKTMKSINNRLHKQLKAINNDVDLTLREEVDKIKNVELYREGNVDVDFN